MCIVVNRDGQGIKANGTSASIDLAYAAPNRSSAGIPAAIPSLYASEIYVDSATAKTYRSMGANTTTWNEAQGTLP